MWSESCYVHVMITIYQLPIDLPKKFRTVSRSIPIDCLVDQAISGWGSDHFLWSSSWPPELDVSPNKPKNSGLESARLIGCNIPQLGVFLLNLKGFFLTTIHPTVKKQLARGLVDLDRAHPIGRNTPHWLVESFCWFWRVFLIYLTTISQQPIKGLVRGFFLTRIFKP